MQFFAYLIDLGFKKLWRIEKPTPTPSQGPESESESNLVSQKYSDLDIVKDYFRHI